MTPIQRTAFRDYHLALIPVAASAKHAGHHMAQALNFGATEDDVRAALRVWLGTDRLRVAA